MLKKFKTNYKTGLYLLISLGIIVSSILYIFWINFSNDIEPIRADKGAMDLKQLDEQETIKLDGEWEFYPNLLLGPEDDFDEYSHVRKYVDLPGSWGSYLHNNGSVEGGGTYRLKIHLPRDRGYGFKFRTIRTAYRAFANGNEIVSVGNTSLERSNHSIDSKYRIGFLQTTNQEIDLIINVSNFNMRTGGIISSVEFGTGDSILKVDRMDRLINGATITAAIVLGLYFLLTYFQRGKDRELIYFGLTSILIGLYMSTLNEQVLDLIIDYQWARRIQIQLIVISLVAICLTRFSASFFKKHISKRITDLITVLGLVNILSIVLATEHLNLNSVVAFQLSSWSIVFLSFVNIIYVFIKNIKEQRDSIGYILVIIASFFSFSNAMILKILFDLSLGRLFSVLVFILLVDASILIASKLHSDYRNAQNLSKKLIKEDELKDEFLARVSHELRTPIHVILNSSQSLAEGKKGPLNTDQQESLFFITQEGKRLSRLINNLLDASKIKEEQTKVHLSPVDINRLVENILREMALLIPEDRDISLINDLSEELPIISSDYDKLTQIIYNLVNNAIKYTESGKIILSAKLEKDNVIFEVKDTGIGIKEESISEVFKVFYKDDRRSESGMGLGLAITKQLVEVLGGEISVVSIYGKGSSFKFNLPINDEGSLEMDTVEAIKEIDDYRPVIKQAPDYLVDKPTILLVDDRISNQKVLLDILEDRGYNLLLAKDGQETLSILDEYSVDLIILDFMLPDMSGADITKNIRKRYSIVELPIIMLTASGKGTDFEDSFEFGANSFIRKPADGQELITKIQSLLQMKESVKEGLKKELQYFYSQISPHFLYNTINTIIGLSYTDSEKARDALNNLSIYFRAKLDIYKDKSLISLEEELELVRAYLELEEMRYGDKVKYIIDIEENLDISIPPLTIQPLVENSIRHGISQKKDGGIIEIRARRHEDKVVISVKDNGVGMSQEKTQDLLNRENNRLGFTNVMEKLKVMRGTYLNIESQEQKGTTIWITIQGVKHNASYNS